MDRIELGDFTIKCSLCGGEVLICDDSNSTLRVECRICSNHTKLALEGNNTRCLVCPDPNVWVAEHMEWWVSIENN